jgi:hypothetical protein
VDGFRHVALGVGDRRDPRAGAVVLGAIVWACMHTVFVEPREAAFLRRKSRRVYYRVLAKSAIPLRGSAYWRYHRLGLKELNETINWPYLMLQIGLISLWLADFKCGYERNSSITLLEQVKNHQATALLTER